MKVILVDGQNSVRQLLSVFLSAHCPQLEIIAQFENGTDAIHGCLDFGPDLVILDALLPGLNGNEVMARIKKGVPRAATLVYSSASDPILIGSILRLRPDAFIEKSDDLETLCQGLDAVAVGKTFFSQSAVPFLLDSESRSNPIGRNPSELNGYSASCGSPLSRREIEVLQLIAEGYTNKEAAARLGIATKTVQNHRQHIMSKLNLHTASALTRYAIRKNLISH